MSSSGKQILPVLAVCESSVLVVHFDWALKQAWQRCVEALQPQCWLLQ